MEKFSLAGKTALITGSTRGLGHAYAAAFAEAGAKVIVHGRSKNDAGDVARNLRDRGFNADFVFGDLCEPGAAERLTAAALELCDGALDVLVNNAGACIHKPALDVTPEEWNQVVRTNFDSLWWLSQAVGSRMVRRGKGCIVNAGSISAIIVNRPQMQPAYNASKAAVHQLTKSLAAEWAPYGVRVNAVAPGYIKTDMSPVDEPRFRRYWIEDAPMQRYAVPDEVSPAVVFLASDASSFITGEILVVDGGYTLF